MIDAFDSDVLIYATVRGNELGRRVRALFSGSSTELVGVGSLLLLPELLSKPIRAGDVAAARELGVLLGRLDLRPLDEPTARLSARLGARYRLRAADAAHLATAVQAGADRFITNNSKDFPREIAEVGITYPAQLPPA